ncbi:recombination mediator RecR [Pontiella sulfatireligans]|uniref:Recombination protein RecR n=1 Tax=Pontiella sulfatireligans TaxID=2750658 RepID=A0A6C2ULH7_9BACT|nr:recombination mediator RecR [Pontiella sulfatireligans]VGO20191.1 Recombination protein RecR [Pontiella sulfatireligans]
MEHLAPLDNLVAALSRLPGIGRRTAERMAMALVQDDKGLMRILANVLLEADDGIVSCERCGSITLSGVNPCELCLRPRRDAHILCVVESPADIMKIEESGGFQGRYHALMGRLSPMHGTGAADLRVDKLLERITSEGIEEVVIALGADVESDATASYLREVLATRSVKVSRIGFGLPTGSAIEYSDASTLARAIQGRQEMS